MKVVLAFTIGSGLIVISEPLFEPSVKGEEETTRILYPVPANCPDGIDTLMEPFVVDVIEPIVVGELKSPKLSDSWAVKTFPVGNIPLTVYETERLSPGQNEDGPNAVVLIITRCAFRPNLLLNC